MRLAKQHIDIGMFTSDIAAHRVFEVILAARASLTGIMPRED